METLLNAILTNADMRNYQPNNMRVGLKGGVFFGLLEGTVLPAAVGDITCTAFDAKTFGAKGKVNEIKILGIKELPFDAKITLTAQTEAFVEVFEPVKDDEKITTLPEEHRLTYYFKQGNTKATIVQTKADQAWHRGAYTEFWVTHNLHGYPNFNIRFWWART